MPQGPLCLLERLQWAVAADRALLRCMETHVSPLKMHGINRG